MRISLKYSNITNTYYFINKNIKKSNVNIVSDVCMFDNAHCNDNQYTDDNNIDIIDSINIKSNETNSIAECINNFFIKLSKTYFILIIIN